MPDSWLTFAGVIVTALVGPVVLAWMTNRQGRRMGQAAEPVPPASENGEHAHTRDLVRQARDEILRKLEGIERGQQASRQSAQIGTSFERLLERLGDTRKKP